MTTRRRPRDIAAGLLGLLCLLVAAGVVLHLVVGLAAAVIQIAAPIVLIAVAVLALVGLRR
ncbi:MAG: hypothetical protein LBH76_03705 [Propionibacteriaceae bacterium]|nr:hypothetical protein [Propionibacteriaceae bacterium]